MLHNFLKITEMQTKVYKRIKNKQHHFLMVLFVIFQTDHQMIR